MGIVIGLIGIGFVIYFVVSQVNKAASEKRRLFLVGEAQSFFQKLKNQEPIKRPNTPVLMKSGEVPWLFDSCLLSEPGSNRVYGGVGVRVMKGVSIFGGESSSYQSLKGIDRGTLTLTNERLVFVGGLESRKFLLKDISSVKLYNNAIGIISDKKNKNSIFEVTNPYLWNHCIKIFTESLEDDTFGENYGRISLDDSDVIDIESNEDEEESEHIVGKDLSPSELEKIQGRVKANMEETMEVMKQIGEGEFPIVREADKFLEEGEHAFLVETTKLFEVMYDDSNEAQNSEKDKNVFVNAGEYFTNYELKLLDKGIIGLTNRRIHFKGDKLKKSFLKDAFVLKRTFGDSVEILEPNESKHFLFNVKNSLLWKMLSNDMNSNGLMAGNVDEKELCPFEIENTPEIDRKVKWEYIYDDSFTESDKKLFLAVSWKITKNYKFLDKVVCPVHHKAPILVLKIKQPMEKEDIEITLKPCCDKMKELFKAARDQMGMQADEEEGKNLS